ncbi:Sulfurtransferase [Methanimicrococcus stummii]|uniref:Sulfurtransferase n=1 Tax=Methanimicrococcus stummii TaxID=3028294 RepID=A0AA96VIC2_9EURY|nr:rhodanese-like domain-containing protein [Methanimicrococcus sp. Es2]WNY28831.1 Sulfurtransferase [Methanimicrococcus sp. Es2]
MSYKRESPEKIQELMAEKDVNLIDVRSPQERISDGSIAGSENIDIRGPDFNQKLNALDKNKTLVLYCRAGNRSQTAAQRAVDAGFKDVYMIEGGIAGWESSGLPVEK